MANISNYFQRAVALLASQFQIMQPDGSLTNFQKMLYAMIASFQEIQTQENLLQTMRSLDTAQGIQLDGLGQIIGLSRASGQPDDSATIDGVYVQGYREDLQFQIFINYSSGTPEQVIKILAFLTKASRVWYIEIYPAAYQMATNGLVFPANPSDLVGAIQKVSPAGVQFVGITATYNENPFVFSEDPFSEQFWVAPIPNDPTSLNPLQVDPGSGAVDFYVQRGETVNPEFGGCFCEAILSTYPNYTFDLTSAGQFTESIQN